MSGTLYVTAVPIGNIEDFSARARRILNEADIVAAEDTRNALKLFNILGIRNKTVSNHRFNEKQQVDYLVTLLEQGKNIALVSDAGTPCVSDPGGILVKAAAERGIAVVGVCGPSAVITALSVCGFCSGSFAFYGFLPKGVKEIKNAIEAARKSGVCTSVFFESPKRIIKTMEVFSAETPNSEICLCNDLTKKFERIYRGTPQKIFDEIANDPATEKGEYTLAANLGAAAPEIAASGDLSPEAMLADHIVKNNCGVKDAVNALALKYRGLISKKEFYAASLKLRSVFSSSYG